MRFLQLLYCLAWIIDVHAGDPTGNLDDEQVDLIRYSSPINLSSQIENKILSLGIIDGAITKLNNIYPNINITDLDRTNNRLISQEDQYDTIVIYLALEKDPDRDQKLRMMYQALKPKGKGMIILGPKNSRSIHYWIERFVEGTEWKLLASNTPNLTLEEYRILIQNSGFNIIDERNWMSILCNRDTSQWICDRWKVPLSMEFPFACAFYRFLSTTFKRETCFFTGMYNFIVEK